MLHTGHEYPILQSSLARNGFHCELFILIPSHISWPQYPQTRCLPLLSHSRTWPGCHLIRLRGSPGSGRRMYPRGTLEFSCMWILWYHPVLWVYESLQFCGKIKQCCQQWNSAFFSTPFKQEYLFVPIPLASQLPINLNVSLLYVEEMKEMKEMKSQI